MARIITERKSMNSLQEMALVRISEINNEIYSDFTKIMVLFTNSPYKEELEKLNKNILRQKTWLDCLLESDE